MVGDDVLSKWMRIEMASVNRALVTAPRPIGDLVHEDAPTARTRGGEAHAFDPHALRALHDALGPLARRRVRVPVTFWVDKDVGDAAAVQDAAAVDALKALGRVRADQEMRGERFWLALSRAHDIANAYPTLFQFAYY